LQQRTQSAQIDRKQLSERENSRPAVCTAIVKNSRSLRKLPVDNHVNSHQPRRISPLEFIPSHAEGVEMTIGVICPSLCISPFSIACFALFCGQYSGLIFCELCALCGQSTQSFKGDRPKFRVQRRSPRSSNGLSMCLIFPRAAFQP
jgi:hypothetical protein